MKSRLADGKKNIIGSQILKLREKSGWSKKELAAKLQVMGSDLSELSVHRIEQGTRLVRDIEMNDLCRIFSVTPDQILGFTNPAWSNSNT